MNGHTLTLIAICAPGIGSLIALLLWLLKQCCHGVVAVTPFVVRRWLGPLGEVLRPLVPPRGRVIRATSWFFLFVTLISLLLLPAMHNPWALATTEGISAHFGFNPSEWLVGLTIAVVSLCAAVAAWDPESPALAWVGILVTEFLCLAAVASRNLFITVGALDLAAVTFGLSLALYWRPNTPFASQAVLRAVRHWLTVSLLASALCWLGLRLSMEPSRASLAALLVAVGMLIRSGVFPFTSPWLQMHQLLPHPAAMLLTGAFLPAVLLTLVTAVPAWSMWLTVWFFVGGVLSWTMSTREADLRRAVGHWSFAGLTTAMLYVSFSRQDAETGMSPYVLMILGIATGSCMATFLVGLVETDLGHGEIPRLRGLAARSPAGMNWMVIAGLILASAPPFSSFASLLLSVNHSVSTVGVILAAVLWIVGLSCLLVVIGRTYLGLPRVDHGEPLDMTARQRLVLLLLLVCCLIGSVAPTTLFRAPELLPAP